MAIHPDASVHPTALVDSGAQLAAGVRIGPYCTIGGEAALAEDVELKSHVVVTGATAIGPGTVVFPFAVLGEIPQDLKFRGERTRLVIGARNRIREGVTMNTGTDGGGGVTRVGDDGLFMTGAHVGHDAQVGDGVILANHVALAGHCVLGDGVIVGGLSGVHQRVRIGEGAIIGAVTMVTNDVIPFGLVQGPRGVLDGLNLVGLKRRGVPREDIAALRAAFRDLAAAEGSFAERAARVHAAATSRYVRMMTDFILTDSDRSFLTPG